MNSTVDPNCPSWPWSPPAGQLRDAYVVTRTGLKDLGVSVALASRKNSQAGWREGTVNVQMNSFTKERQTHRLKRTNLRLPLGKECGEGIVTESGIDMCTLLYLKWITDKVLLYSTSNSAQCYVAAWMGGESGGEWIHVYVWLSPFVAHRNLSQHC